MRVLVTGANGFVGSHILDELIENGHSVSVLLRRTSDTRYISDHLDTVSIFYGSVSDRDVLREAVAGVDAVVHCAAKTKALDDNEYDAVNIKGTECVMEASSRAGGVGQFVYISSVSVTGPTLPGRAARETDPPNPVTRYARSKLGGEKVVTGQTAKPWTILRLAGVYGARDTDFLAAFSAAKRGCVPLPAGRSQTLSLVYGRDVAIAVRHCLGRDEALGRTYNVAAEPPCTAEHMAQAIARAMGKTTRTIPLPGPIVYTACLVQDLVSRVRQKPHILSLQKYAEIRAAGWECSTERIRDELGFVAPTALADGLSQTAAWYKREGLL